MFGHVNKLCRDEFGAPLQPLWTETAMLAAIVAWKAKNNDPISYAASAAAFASAGYSESKSLGDSKVERFRNCSIDPNNKVPDSKLLWAWFPNQTLGFLPK
jgi:hypothetical protein